MDHGYRTFAATEATDEGELIAMSHRSLVIVHWSLVIGHWSAVISQAMHFYGPWTMDYGLLSMVQ